MVDLEWWTMVDEKTNLPIVSPKRKHLANYPTQKESSYTNNATIFVRNTKFRDACVPSQHLNFFKNSYNLIQYLS